jgi:orotate phosphoribosyltransferase
MNMMINELPSVEEIFRNCGGWKVGHTRFLNGYHGNGWFNKGFVIRSPKLLDEITAIQARRVIEHFGSVDLVIGPVINGAIVSSYVARHLDTEMAFLRATENGVEFYKTNKPVAPKKVVIIEDLIFTGTEMKINIDYLKESGFEVMGASVWINRRTGDIAETKLDSLLKAPFEMYKEEDCPLCKKAVPIIYDGIRE